MSDRTSHTEGERSDGSDSEDSDEELEHLNPRRRRADHKTAGRRKVTKAKTTRSVLAAITRSKTNQAIEINKSTEAGHAEAFTFLELESYACSCCTTPSSNSTQQTSQQFAGSSIFLTCKVLQFFGMIYMSQFRALFCPAHNCFVPMSFWARHVSQHHKDWVSVNKVDECARMANHVAQSCQLDIEQKVEDLQLPDTLRRPFVPSTVTAAGSHVFKSLRCPKCGLWEAISTTGESDRLMRRHLRDTGKCRKGPITNWKSIRLEGPCWTYRVKTSPRTSHVFILPDDWDECGENEEIQELPEFPEFPSQGHSVLSFSALTASQDWPITLRWTEYDAEISASSHVAALRQLIALPVCGCKRGIRSPSFLEEGLHQAYHWLFKYLKTAMTFVHKKHKRVINAVISE